MKIFKDTNAYVYAKQRKSMQDGQAVCFYALTTWSGRPQIQKQNCKVLIMIVREKGEIGTNMLHSTRRALQIIATV